MKLLNLLIILCFPWILQSCGVPCAVITNLKVSQQFLGGGFDNGLIITGTNQNGKKVTVSLSASQEASVSLEKGTWTFKAVGWDGSPVKFSGTAYCGSATKVLVADSDVVDISLTTAGCTPFNFKNLMTSVCGAFYTYNLATDTYAPTGPSDDAFCSTLPKDMQGNLTAQYRVMAVDIDGDKPAVSKFYSSCTNMVGPRINLPLLDIPLSVQAYPDAASCAGRINGVSYTFRNGISSGASFDSRLEQNGSSQYRLMLAAFKTKKASSPFMQEIPKIGCTSNGVGNCFSSPIANIQDVRVPFDIVRGYRDMTVLKNLPSDIKSCPADIFNDSQYFNSDSCKIKNNNMIVQIGRNLLTCNATSAPSFHLISYVYRKGEFIYVLDLNSSSSSHRINVLTLNGKIVTQFELGGTDYINLAADANRNLYLTRVGGLLRKYTYNKSSDSYSFDDEVGIPGNSNHLEVTTNRLLVGIGATVFPYKLNLDTGGTGYTYSSAISSIAFYKGKLYASLVSNPNLQISNYNGMTIDPPATMNRTYSILKVAISDNQLFLHKMGPKMDAFKIEANNTLTLLSDNDISSFFNSTAGLIAYNDKLLSLPMVASNSFQVSSFSGGTYPELDNAATVGADYCLETVPLNIGTGYSVVVDSRAHTTYDLINDSIGLAGINSLTAKAQTYFTAVNHDDGPNHGGRISDAREMLGPKGIGAAFSQYANCLALKTAAIAAGSEGITNRITLENEGVPVTFTATAKYVTTELIPTTICEDSNPQAGSCSGPRLKYDLLMTGQKNGTNGNSGEMFAFKVKCGLDIGQVEFFEFGPKEVERKSLRWNTSISSEQRFEVFSYEKDNSLFRAKATVFLKDGDDSFQSRTVSTETETSGTDFTRGEVSQLFNDGTTIFQSRIHIGDNTTSFGTATYAVPEYSFNFDFLRDNTDFAAFSVRPADEAGATSSNNSATDVDTTFFQSPTFPTFTYVTSEGYPLSIDAFKDVANTSAVILGAFDILKP